MKGSFRIGQVAGIELRLHLTFLILVAWIVGSHLLSGRGLAGAFYGLVSILVVFTIIVLHELGHAMTARHYGIKTHDITLLPIGGLARLDRLPEKPVQEFWVAVAGPAVNVALAGLGYLLLVVTAGPSALFNVTVTGGNPLAQFVWLNVWLAVFNMLPAFPMDGGRVLRAALALKLGRPRATDIAAAVGQMMAVLFAITGFFVNPFLLFIALFVWLGAEAEASQVRMQDLLGKVKVSAVMARDFKAVETDTTLGELARILVPTFQTEFPVLEQNRLVGMLSAQDIGRGIAEAGLEATVRGFMRTEPAEASPQETLDAVFTRHPAFGNGAVAVVEDGRVVGLVTVANVAEMAMVMQASQSYQPKVVASSDRPQTA